MIWAMPLEKAVATMNKSLAIFLTLFGFGGIPIALGFLLATRGALPQPWLRPWQAGYGFFALGFIMALPAADETRQGTFLPLAHILFLSGVGLHALGWVRLWRNPTPLAVSALPVALYGLLYGIWGRASERHRLAALFSILIALTAVPALLGAHRGLRSTHPHLRSSTTLLLAVNALFWAGRGVYMLVAFNGGDFVYSFTVAGLETTLYLGLLAFLQWHVVMD